MLKGALDVGINENQKLLDCWDYFSGFMAQTNDMQQREVVFNSLGV